MLELLCIATFLLFLASGLMVPAAVWLLVCIVFFITER